jgi:hypothetical protein
MFFMDYKKMIIPIVAAVILLTVGIVLTIINIKTRRNFDLIPAVTVNFLILIMNILFFTQWKTSYVEVKDGRLLYTSVLKSNK